MYTANQMGLLAQQLAAGRHPIEIGQHHARLNNLSPEEALRIQGAATAILTNEDVDAFLAEGETWVRPDGIPTPQTITDAYLQRIERAAETEGSADPR